MEEDYDYRTGGADDVEKVCPPFPCHSGSSNDPPVSINDGRNRSITASSLRRRAKKETATAQPNDEEEPPSPFQEALLLRRRGDEEEPSSPFCRQQNRLLTAAINRKRAARKEVTSSALSRRPPLTARSLRKRAKYEGFIETVEDEDLVTSCTEGAVVSGTRSDENAALSPFIDHRQGRHIATNIRQNTNKNEELTVSHTTAKEDAAAATPNEEPIILSYQRNLAVSADDSKADEFRDKQNRAPCLTAAILRKRAEEELSRGGGTKSIATTTNEEPAITTAASGLRQEYKRADTVTRSKSPGRNEQPAIRSLLLAGEEFANTRTTPTPDVQTTDSSFREGVLGTSTKSQPANEQSKQQAGLHGCVEKQREETDQNNNNSDENTTTDNNAPVVIPLGQVRDTDILCGRGRRLHERQANVNYLKFVLKYRSQYQRLTRKRNKIKLSESLVNHMSRLGWRFLKKLNYFQDQYVEISPVEVRLKVSQVLRERGIRQVERRAIEEKRAMVAI